MTQDAVTHTCPACRSIDRADGIEDGNLYKTLSEHFQHENSVLAAIRTAQDITADRITGFAGSMTFVYIHAIWFVAWIAINIGLVGVGLAFDKFPFGLLTMIVSLEAIFLATFVMISQNRQAKRADVRARLDFETNLRAEIWSVHIGHAIGIDPDHVEEVVKHAVEGANRELGD